MTFEGKKITVGTRSVMKALRGNNAALLYLGKDADSRVTGPLALLAEETGVEVDRSMTMRELGRASGIEIAAGAVALLK